MSNGYRVGVDIGGTHTDVVVEVNGVQADTHKVATTPGRLSDGVVDGLEAAAAARDTDLRSFLAATAEVVHGTTVTTNALLEGDERPTGLLVTEGFRDVVELNVEGESDLFDLRSPTKRPDRAVLPRHLRQPVTERVDSTGTVRTELDPESVHAAVDSLVDAGVECLAIAFMNAYLDASHERRAAELVAERDDVAFEAVSLSSSVRPRFGLYDRVVATVIDASLDPILERYLDDLQAALDDRGFDGRFLVMQATGGLSSPSVVGEHPLRSVNSGPAAAVLGNVATAETAGFEDVVSVDIGGTSSDACLAPAGDPAMTDRNKVGETTVPMAMLDVDTIGAGGGSVAWVDDRDVLQVGPRSAGADPGPACYGQGGTDATVTDATLVLGYLDPETFRGGNRRSTNLPPARPSSAPSRTRLGCPSRRPPPASTNSPARASGTSSARSPSSRATTPGHSRQYSSAGRDRPTPPRSPRSSR